MWAPKGPQSNTKLCYTFFSQQISLFCEYCSVFKAEICGKSCEDIVDICKDSTPMMEHQLLNEG